MDDYSRYAIRVSVAQICQTIGWTKIQSTPLEVLTDFMQEYILGLGRIATNYATIMGHSEPNLTHVSLAFRDMDISFNELKDYVTYFESGSVLDVPKYPIPKESHLNHLKPGSREVLTRPVHVHEHLPPMFPHLENDEFSSNNSPIYDQTNNKICPLPPIKIKLDPSYSTNDDDFIDDDEVRPLRELSSVLMTTSGFLSSAREGKLPEVRSLPPEPLVTKEGKKKKVKDNQRKKDKENRLKKTYLDEMRRADKKLKHKKHKKPQKKSEMLPNRSKDVISSQTPREQDSGGQNKIKVEKEPSPPRSFTNSTNPEKPDYSANFKKSDNNVNPEKSDNNEFMNMDSDEDSELLTVVKSDDSRYSSKDCTNQESSVDAKGNVMIDLSSAPYYPKTNHAINSFDEPEMHIDVVNSSPVNNSGYASNSSPIELYYSDPRAEVNDRCSSFDLGRNSPLIKYERGGFGFDFDRASSEIEFDGTVQEIRAYSPRIKEESLSPQVKLESPFQLKERLSPPTALDHTSSQIKQETESPEINFSNLSPVLNLDQVNTNFVTKSMKLEEERNEVNSTLQSGVKIPGVQFPEFNPNANILSSRSKKKKKKDKKNKDKEKNKFPAEDNAQNKIRLKLKKKKKEHKKETFSMVNDVSGMDPNLNLFSEPPKKMKLEDKWNVQDEFNVKDEILSTIQQESLVIPQKPSKANLPAIKKSTPNNYENTLTNTKISKKVKKKKEESLKHLSEDLFSFEPIKRVLNDEKRKSCSPLPKITFKLGLSPPKLHSEPKPQKIVIKAVTKHDDDDKEGPSVSGSYQLQHATNLNVPGVAATHQSSHEKANFPYSAQETTYVTDPNQIWICPACNRPDDGSPMIACDKCDLWFHWVCVGIREAIEGDWFCKMCLAKKEQDKVREKKKSKKHKKKKL